MNVRIILVAMFALATPSVASSQGWVKWDSSKQQTAPTTQQQGQVAAQPTPLAQQARSDAPANATIASSASFDKAECDAEVAKAYPVNLWAPGLGKKREELFAACMARGTRQATVVGSSPANRAECDAEVARAYPVNLWAPGLGKKREELFAACMAR